MDAKNCWFSYLRILSHGTLFIEVMAPLLILCPVFNSIGRMLGALLLMSMHCGFALCMEIGFFPFLPLVCLWIVVPEDFWAWATRNFVSRSARNIHICYFPDEPLAVYVAHLIDGNIVTLTLLFNLTYPIRSVLFPRFCSCCTLRREGWWGSPV